MSDAVDGVREHCRAAVLACSLKAKAGAFGPEDLPSDLKNHAAESPQA